MSYELDMGKDKISHIPTAEMLSRRRNQSPSAMLGGRIPPQAIDMEQAVLGALLLEKDAMDKVVGIVSGEKFYKEDHRLIFDSLTALYSASKPIDLLTVKNHLSGVGMLEAAGGVFYLTELTSKVASSNNIEYHARVIHQKWILRSLIRFCDDTINKAFDETSDPFEVHAGLLKDLEELEPKSDELVNGSDLIPEIAKDVEAAMRGESPSIKLGFRDMDKEYAFDFGEYVVVAGDSGTGKTTFIMQAAKRIRKEYKDIPILFNARDMDGKKVVSRDLASEMGMSQMRFRTGNGIEKHHFDDMNELACAYDGIYFCSEFTSAALRSHIRKLKKKLGLSQDAGMIVINDYLQLGDGDGGSREQVVGNVSLDDKKIAKRNNALVIDLSQVNESAGKLRPNHKSIRESRAPYHHADWVIFLYSPSKNGEERYEDGSSTAGIIEAILDKVRCGRPGNIIKLQMTTNGLITDLSDGSTEYEESLNLPVMKPNNKIFNEPSHSDEQPGKEGGGDFFPF
jgi:replicative DNA helicase